jgi:negative regulator of flagellin synthesis FlgM
MINEVKAAQQAAIQSLSNNQQADKAEMQAHHAERKEKQSSSGSTQNVSLTDTAAKLRQLEAQIANQPVVDTQRVESVKKAISDGSFKVDSHRVADKMAEFENLLASKSEKP